MKATCSSLLACVLDKTVKVYMDSPAEPDAWAMVQVSVTKDSTALSTCPYQCYHDYETSVLIGQSYQFLLLMTSAMTST